MNAPSSSGENSGCWRRLLIALGIAVAAGAFLVFVLAILVWQSVAWLKNSGEPRMAEYEPLNLSPGEEEDVQRVMNGINEAKQKDTVYNEYMTTRVFNGAMQKIIEDEQRKATPKPDAPLFVRGAFVDGRMSMRFTIPVKPEETGGPPQPQKAAPGLVPERKYVNAEALFDLDIENGEILRAELHKLVLRGRDAPLLVRWVVSYLLGAEKARSHQQKDSPANHFRAIKLLRREGDRLHIMLDGARLREQDAGPEKDLKPQMKADEGR
ncbi:MAG: hypothetical protein ABSE73_17310 [Planctomycetota bacterium]